MVRINNPRFFLFITDYISDKHYASGFFYYTFTLPFLLLYFLSDTKTDTNKLETNFVQIMTSQVMCKQHIIAHSYM